MRDLRDLSVRENLSVARFSLYMAEHLQRLSLDPETGVCDFHPFPGEAQLGLLEQGQLAWHRGDFSSAVDLIEKDIEKHGENEPRLFWLAMSHMRRAEADNCLAKLTGAVPQTPHHGPVNAENHPTAEPEGAAKNHQQAGAHGASHHGSMCSLPPDSLSRR